MKDLGERRWIGQRIEQLQRRKKNQTINYNHFQKMSVIIRLMATLSTSSTATELYCWLVSEVEIHKLVSLKDA